MNTSVPFSNAAPGGLHSQQISDGSWEWPITDGLDSIRGMVETTAAPLEGRLYSPYGEPYDVTGTPQTPFGFTGELTDNNGLVYLRSRYYNPTLGLFPSLDPLEGTITQPMSLNRYSYVQGNVVNKTDPSGLCANNDTNCQTAVSCLERDFPSAYVFWDNRPETLPPCPSPAPTQLPTLTPCPTPNQPTITVTPRPTISPVPFRRFNGLAWDNTAIPVLHEGLRILQRARGAKPLANVVLARVNLADSGISAQTYYRNDGLHPRGAELTILFSSFWNTRRNTDPAFGKWIVVHELNHVVLYQQGPELYRDLARNSKNAFIGTGRGESQAHYPTKYAFDNRDNMDNPEYLVDAMTGLVWDLTGEAIPITSPEIYAAPGITPSGGLQYPYNVGDIRSIDGQNTPLVEWIRTNVPGFLP